MFAFSNDDRLGINVAVHGDKTIPQRNVTDMRSDVACFKSHKQSVNMFFYTFY